MVVVVVVVAAAAAAAAAAAFVVVTFHAESPPSVGNEIVSKHRFAEILISSLQHLTCSSCLDHDLPCCV